MKNRNRVEAGKKAAETNKKKFGADFYARIGAEGGRSYDRTTSPPRGFDANRELAKEASLKGAARRWNHAV